MKLSRHSSPGEDTVDFLHPVEVPVIDNLGGRKSSDCLALDSSPDHTVDPSLENTFHSLLSILHDLPMPSGYVSLRQDTVHQVTSLSPKSVLKQIETIVTSRWPDWIQIMTIVLQWNCGGYYPNFEVLTTLINVRMTSRICLKELQLQLCGWYFFPPSEHLQLLKSSWRCAKDKGGVKVLIHKYFSHTLLPLTTPLHAVETWLDLKGLHFVFLYLTPSSNYGAGDLLTLLNQLPPPVLLLVDFKIRHFLWGRNNYFL